MKSLIIGVAGGTGSGKTTLAENLKKINPSSTLILHLDDYAYPRHDMPKIAGLTCFDHPSSINHAKLTGDIASLKAGKAVEISVRYPRNRKPDDPPRKRKVITVQPAPIIIVEGFLALYYADLRDQFDLSIFLQSDIDKTVARRANQASNEAEYVTKIVLPMHHSYVAPSASFADYIIDVNSQDSADVARAAKRYIEAKLTDNP